MAGGKYFLAPGLTSIILQGGGPVQIANQNINVSGGYVINPLSGLDQKIHIPEPLYVNIVVPAQIIGGASPTNVELMPGETYVVPPNTNVWVTAATSGHSFTAFFVAPYEVQYPPSPVAGDPGTQTSALGGVGGPFPPPGVTGLTDVMPSYLYQEYSDDDDLQTFVAAQNTMQQDYVDTFNALNLPVYTGHPSLVAGKLLDWVGQGVYGMARPYLDSGGPLMPGPLNTWGCNMPAMSMAVLFEYFQEPFRLLLPAINMLDQLTVGNVYITDDDIYRRIITWHFFKADGKYFNTRWLKRRVWRFCYGWDGVSPDYAVDPISGVPHYSSEHYQYSDADDKFISNTDQISVTLGVNRNVTIRFVLGNRKVTGGGMLNAWGPNGFEPAIHNKNPPWDIGTDKTPSGGGVNWQFNPVVNTGYASSVNNGILVIMGSSSLGMPIVAGMTVHGAGIPDKTNILWQISGTIGGDGSYQIAQNFTITSVPVTFTPNTWVNLGGGGAVTAPGGIYINDIETTYEILPPVPFMYVFKEAVDIGVLELPYQYNYTVHIG